MGKVVRANLLASIDQSLQRLGLDYVDIFYVHRHDAETPLEETIGALDHIVRQGKAIYAGVSNYSGPQLAEAVALAKQFRFAPIVVEQSSYSLLTVASKMISSPPRSNAGLV